jgi:hypothetical protein
MELTFVPNTHPPWKEQPRFSPNIFISKYEGFPQRFPKKKRYTIWR